MKKIYAFLAACLLSISAAWADYKIVYTVFDEATGTLTYYYDYDSKRKEVNGKIYDIENVRFQGYAKDIKKVHINASMGNCYLLKSTKWMFFSGDYSQTLSNLTEITGMQNLNTEDVKDMSEMFYGCSALTSIDLSQLNTQNVTNMDGMFQNCSSLESLDLSYFWTHNVERMSFMFDGCKALKSVNLANFRTENVQWMDGMFYDCESLTELDIANFDMRKVTTVSGMFGNCSSLQTIYCNNNWNTIGMDADELFDGCFSLVGENGTVYDVEHTYLDYARPDIVSGAKGYFTSKKETFAFVSGDNKDILTFACGTGKRNIPNAMLVPIQIDDESAKALQAQVTTLFFMDGFEDSEITKARNLILHTSPRTARFYNTVKEVVGLEHINTSVLTNWNWMFEGMKIKEIDLTKVDMKSVQQVYGMFAYCEQLETIYCNEDLSNRRSPGTSDLTFMNCYRLKGGNGTPYDAEHYGVDYAHPDAPGNPGYFTAKAQGIERAQNTEHRAQKIIRNGQLFIERNGKTFNAQGAEVR